MLLWCFLLLLIRNWKWFSYNVVKGHFPWCSYDDNVSKIMLWLILIYRVRHISWPHGISQRVSYGNKNVSDKTFKSWTSWCSYHIRFLFALRFQGHFKETYFYYRFLIYNFRQVTFVYVFSQSTTFYSNWFSKK